MQVLGIDENGLGPQLGPMVASAVGLRVSRYHAETLSALGRRIGVDDSKSTASFQRMARAESWALALVEATTRSVPRDVDEFLSLVVLGGRTGLREHCPSRGSEACWAEPLSLPAFGGKLSEGRAMLRAFAEEGVAFDYVRSSVSCVKKFNKEVRFLGSKLQLDLKMFESLVLDARGSEPASLQVFCGMVGGIKKYAPRFHLLCDYGVAVVEERRGLSSYEVDGVGSICFEVSADAKHLAVSAASMVGKYVRELMVERQNRFYLGQNPSLRAASGYHDPVTKAFIAETLSLREAWGIEDECFRRNS